MATPNPKPGTSESTWWRQGAAAEAALRESYPSAEGEKFAKYADAIARTRPGSTAAQLAETTLYVFGGKLTMRYALRLWWRWRRRS